MRQGMRANAQVRFGNWIILHIADNKDPSLAKGRAVIV